MVLSVEKRSECLLRSEKKESWKEDAAVANGSE